MDNSIYISLSRQNALFHDMAVTSNNIANINTPGYNAEKLQFADYMVQDQQNKDSYALDPTSYRDTTNGAIRTTGNTFDLAINGHGYFQVETPLGVRYTRAGDFTLNQDGTLVTMDGNAVLGSDGGQITIPSTAKNIIINGAGQVSADGEEVGQVGVMDFADEQKMQRLGNSLYNAAEKPTPTTTARVVQGGIESSNVQPVSELVRVMNISRSAADTSKFIEVMYDLQRKTSNTYTHAQSA